MVQSRKEIDLTRRQADTFEAVANVPEDEFEKIVTETKSAKKELTTEKSSFEDGKVWLGKQETSEEEIKNFLSI